MGNLLEETEIMGSLLTELGRGRNFVEDILTLSVVVEAWSKRQSKVGVVDTGSKRIVGAVVDMGLGRRYFVLADDTARLHMLLIGRNPDCCNCRHR